jgi:hypothetical protein
VSSGPDNKSARRFDEVEKRVKCIASKGECQKGQTTSPPEGVMGVNRARQIVRQKV